MTSPDPGSGKNTILLPVHSAFSKEEIDGVLRGFGKVDTVVFQTSGSTGQARLVVHSRAGLLASAVAVNAHLGASDTDIWLRALPMFHVGGYGVHARAEAVNAGVFVMEARWSAECFVAACETSRVTLTSLVPTQIFDLVQAGKGCPEGLRAVLVGGGHLERSLEERARVLGWPITRTYGLSEAGSQVATQQGEELVLLRHLEAALGDGGRLKLRGESMALGYLLFDEAGGWGFEELMGDDGWFQTDDLVTLNGTVLRFCGRASSRVKVLGELVDVEALERAFLNGLNQSLDGALVALDDPRAEHEMVLVINNALRLDDVAPLVVAFNASVAGFEQISRVVQVDVIPRSELGKVRRTELLKRVIQAEK